MTKFYLFFITLFFTTLASAQIEYLDLTGLTNTNAITDRQIGSSSVTFSANITSSGRGLPDPIVADNGNLVLHTSETAYQCITLNFSSNTKTYITDHSNFADGDLEENDLLSIDNTNYTLTDPADQIIMTNTSQTPSVAEATFRSEVSKYATWNITHDLLTNVTICGQRIDGPHSPNLDTYVPIRIGAVGSSLPIELLEFKATSTAQQKVQLDWITEKELNNDYFTIERSKEGTNWETLSNIKGGGTTDTQQTYRFIDTKPYAFTSYYRLKQTDFDGNFSYSNISTVHMKGDKEIKVYPNPAVQQITVSNINAETQDLIVTDFLGNGVNHKISKNSSSGTSVELDLSNLPTGFYFVKTAHSVQKIYKQ